MKASREYRRLIALRRRRFGRKNGVIPSGLLDMPFYDAPTKREILHRRLSAPLLRRLAQDA